jgi:hypothetical protein
MEKQICLVCGLWFVPDVLGQATCNPNLFEDCSTTLQSTNVLPVVKLSGKYPDKPKRAQKAKVLKFKKESTTHVHKRNA